MKNEIPVQTSARHAHLSHEHVEILFGKGASLTPVRGIGQAGQFASEERVTVAGPRGELPRVIILGPSRDETQVELTLTEARKLGINAPIRETGDTAGSASCRLIGPAGEVELSEGVIISQRHIHMTPDMAKDFGLTDKQIVSVKIDTPERSLIFGDVIVRLHPDFSLAMFIDTDESNAANIVPGTTCSIVYPVENS